MALWIGGGLAVGVVWALLTMDVRQSPLWALVTELGWSTGWAAGVAMLMASAFASRNYGAAGSPYWFGVAGAIGAAALGVILPVLWRRPETAS